MAGNEQQVISFMWRTTAPLTYQGIKEERERQHLSITALVG
jgi:hypothetical protein